MSRIMEYIRDRFRQDGFNASMATRTEVDGKSEVTLQVVTVSMQKHLPALPCTCGCKSLCGHVEAIETPALTEEDMVEARIGGS